MANRILYFTELAGLKVYDLKRRKIRDRVSSGMRKPGTSLWRNSTLPVLTRGQTPRKIGKSRCFVAS